MSREREAEIVKMLNGAMGHYSPEEIARIFKVKAAKVRAIAAKHRIALHQAGKPLVNWSDSTCATPIHGALIAKKLSEGEPVYIPDIANDYKAMRHRARHRPHPT